MLHQNWRSFHLQVQIKEVLPLLSPQKETEEKKKKKKKKKSPTIFLSNINLINNN